MDENQPAHAAATDSSHPQAAPLPTIYRLKHPLPGDPACVVLTEEEAAARKVFDNDEAFEEWLTTKTETACRVISVVLDENGKVPYQRGVEVGDPLPF